MCKCRGMIHRMHKFYKLRLQILQIKSANYLQLRVEQLLIDFSWNTTSNYWVINNIKYYLRYICSNQISIMLLYWDKNTYIYKVELMKSLEFLFVKVLLLITFFITNFFWMYFVHIYSICFSDQRSDFIAYIHLIIHIL